MNSQHLYDQLLAHAREVRLLSSIGSVLGWDERTYMPAKASPYRAEQIALLARLAHEKNTDPRVADWLSHLETSELAKDRESVPAVNIREIRRGYDRATKLPTRLVEEIARTATRAQGVWQEARQNDDFAAFAPWLEKMVALKREEAQAVGYRESPYDALLDEYEPGATAGEITRLFADLRKDLVPLVAALGNAPRKPDLSLLHRDFAPEVQHIFCTEAGSAIGFDFSAGRLDTTTHPFCTDLGPLDCRLTTRYHPRSFGDGFFGVLHEAGHGIYQQGLDPDAFGTPMGNPISLGIHESQSRLWENQVGRSLAFWQHFFPRAQQKFPQSLGTVAFDDFYFAINNVERSYIRVEADEVTYNLHIILRFEIEQALIGGTLAPGDVPDAWNENFRRLFDLTPPSHALGSLQDIHWSMGGLGYFPTYTLGNLYAAQFMEQARKDLGDLDTDFRQGQFGRLKGWLNQKIHRQGSRYWPRQLCEKVTGRPLDHRPFIEYLRGKFGPLFGVSL